MRVLFDTCEDLIFDPAQGRAVYAILSPSQLLWVTDNLFAVSLNPSRSKTDGILLVVDTDRPHASRVWTTPRMRLAVIAAAIVMAIAVYWICFRRSELCPDRSHTTMTYSISCGIKGVTGIRWLDRVVDFISGGSTYRWVGHGGVVPNGCVNCQGTARITLLKSWLNR